MNQEVKSVKSEERVYIRFINRTEREVDVFWISFEGLPVRYTTLEPDAHYDITTYVTHPWTFVDSKSKDKLVVNEQHVFFPPSWLKLFRAKFPDSPVNIRPHRLVVMITLPVYSLRERCLQVVRDSLNVTLINSERLDELQLPKSVLDDLMILILKKDGFYL